MVDRFSDEARQAVYEVIARRRDVRLFEPGQLLDDAVLARILGAAHQAPSVGYSQPWDFVVVRDRARRERIRESFLRCREAEAARFVPERRAKYLAYRLEGILESALNVCVTVDLRPADEAVLGATAAPEALRASALCAVQNLWLAARAEGIGVGWVSIVEPQVLRAELALPAGIEPVAYLCVGHPIELPARPMLETSGWRARRPLEQAIHAETYAGAGSVASAAVAPSRVAAATTELPAVLPVSPEAAAAAREHQLRLCKPARSLGRLEELSEFYAAARGRFPAPVPERSRLYVFAADHGVVAEGVSAYSSSVTAAMLGNFLSGGAAVISLARSCGVEVKVVDVGVAGDVSALPLTAERQVPLIEARVRAGTDNLMRAPAMTRAEAAAALALGARLADEAAKSGIDLLVAGEMGIGNTTSAAALLCALAGVDPEVAVGRGTGLDERGLAHKRAVVARALALHRPDPRDPLGVLAALGGLELAAMAGLMVGAAARRLPVVVDGFPSGAAALVAVRLRPAARDYLLLAHRSAERGQEALVSALGGSAPLFDLGLRLGEGTGAVLGAHLLKAAVRVQWEMATFATAGIVGRSGISA